MSVPYTYCTFHIGLAQYLPRKSGHHIGQHSTCSFLAGHTGFSDISGTFQPQFCLITDFSSFVLV
jgi:hypothetical protein